MSTSIGQLAQELSRTNPWWRDDQWHERDPDLRSASANGLGYTPTVLDDIGPNGLYLLRGPRRVGKTVTIKQKIRELLASGVPATCIVRVAADGWSAKDLRTLVQNTALPPVPPGHPRWWFLDEISAASGDWDSAIKWLRDNDPDFSAACVVLTGSDAAELTRATGTLAGRRGTVEQPDRTLLPMGFRTFAGLYHEGLPDLACSLAALHGQAAGTYQQMLPWLDELVVAWERYIQYGGYPSSVAACRRGQPTPESFLSELFDVIARDAFGASQLSRTAASALLDRLWGSMATPANLSSIAEDVGTTPDTVARHVTYLRDAYLLWECPQRQPERWVARPRSQPKLYAIDPLIARLAHLRNPERRDIDPTVLTEMIVGVCLHRGDAHSRRPWGDDETVFHLRTPARKEIDFVAAELAGVAVEAKYTQTGRWRSAAATVNASGFNGILVTRNVLDTSDEGAWAVPAGILAYLLDT